MEQKVKMIAFYLPQYHPFPENDEWWGKGFTEWTNVGKAKPLFKGHYQPKVPGELGYYDLRLPEVRERQAELAREAGIYGFCYWHYWFNGHELMERPWNEVVASGKPDFPFCIGWANETWMNKMWNKDGSLAGGKILIEQTYGGEEDARNHFESLLPAFKDERYIKVEGAPLVFVYRGENLPKQVIELWNRYAREKGFPGIYFVGRIGYRDSLSGQKEVLESKGFNAVTVVRLSVGETLRGNFKKYNLLSRLRFNNCPRVVSYSLAAECFIDDFDLQDDVCPAIYPNWDHSPRSGFKGLILNDSTPKNFKKYLKKFVDRVSTKQNKICFLKSWNEWGEGNYVEPDLKYGYGYLDALRDVLKG